MEVKEIPVSEIEEKVLTSETNIDEVARSFMLGNVLYKKLVKDLSAKERSRVLSLFPEYPLQNEKVKINKNELRVLNLGIKLMEAKAYMFARTLEIRENEGKTNE